MGFIIDVVSDPAMAGMRTCSVVDGQQRLTTLFLLITAITCFIKEKGEKDEADEIINKFLINHAEEGNDRFKILLGGEDKNVFENILNNETILNEVDQNSPLARNFKFFKNKLKEKTLEELRKIKDGITKLEFAELSITTEEKPQEIFESMNSTGLSLTKSDLIRNYILMDLEYYKQSRLYEDYWGKMENDLGTWERGNFDDFARYFLTIKHSKLIRQEEIYKEFKNYVEERREKGKEDIFREKAKIIEDILKEMDKYHNYYLEISRNNGSNEDLKGMWKDIVNLGAAPAYPFLMELYRMQKDNKISYDDFKKVIELIISYLVRRKLCERSGSFLNKICIAFLRTIQNSEKENRNIFEDINNKLGSYNGRATFPIDEEVREKAKYIYNRDLVKFLLKKIEISIDKKEMIILDNEDLTLEHIIPQTPNEEWQRILGGADDWRDTHNKYLNRLGNLTLTGKNSEMSNKSFEEKKKIMQGRLRINEYILEQEKWGPEEVEKRTEILIDRIIEIFKIPDLKKK